MEKETKERFRNSTAAWAAIGLGVLAFDMTCKKGDTLSERVDDWLSSEKKAIKVGTYAAIGATALHLANLLPERVDPFHQLTKLKDRMV